MISTLLRKLTTYKIPLRLFSHEHEHHTEEDPRKVRSLSHKNLAKYSVDVEETSHRVIKAIALHGKIQDPSIITLGKTFKELGLNHLDVTEICMMLEEEFCIEFEEDVIEKVNTPHDVAELIAQNWYSTLA